MPDISITDDLGAPVESVKIDLTQPSSLVNYARAQLLHLIVVPDFLALQDKALSVAAPKPIQFQARLGNDFALGIAEPQITLSPKIQAVLRADSTHAGLEATGSLAVSAGATAGELSFGIDAGSSVTIGFCKAFDGAAPAPSLGGAVGQMVSGFVIAASVDDLKMLPCRRCLHGSRAGQPHAIGQLRHRRAGESAGVGEAAAECREHRCAGWRDGGRFGLDHDIGRVPDSGQRFGRRRDRAAFSKAEGRCHAGRSDGGCQRQRDRSAGPICSPRCWARSAGAARIRRCWMA